MHRQSAKWVAMIAAGIFAVSGHASSAVAAETGADSDPCNLLVGGILGGVAGALLDRNRRGRGAAVGAAVGALACVAVNAASKQTRTAQQVEEDYRKNNQGQLPPEDPVVQAYDVTVNPDAGVQAGEKLLVVSNITVVRSANQQVKEVKELLTLTGPDGKTRTAEKKASEQAGSGAYENTFSLTLPKGVSPGAYPVSTQLFVNGKVLAERNQELRVVAQGDALRFVLLDITPAMAR